MNNNNNNDLNPIKRFKEIALGIYISLLFLILIFPPMNKNDVFDGWKIIINWGSGGHSINKTFLLIEIIILTLLYRGLLWVYLSENKNKNRNLKYTRSSEKMKFISERLKNQNILKSNHPDSEELDKRTEPTFFAFIIILLLASFYFYNVFTSSSTMGFWGYFLIVVLLLAGISAFGDFFKSENKYQENSKELNKDQKINLQYSQSSFDDFIAGRMSLAKCFWLYGILIGFVLGFLCGYFAEMYEQRWLYIFPFAYYAVVTIAVWNCATLYTKQKLENKQPYGWAIAAKIYISFNALAVVGQIILILNKN